MASSTASFAVCALLLQRAPACVQDVLACGEEEVARAACERHHPGLNRAFLEAGTPWANVRRGGDGSRPAGPRCSNSSSGGTATRDPQPERQGAVFVVLFFLRLALCPPPRPRPWPAVAIVQGSIGGTTETVRRALKSKGHERLMRVIHLLTGGKGRRCTQTAT